MSTLARQLPILEIAESWQDLHQSVKRFTDHSHGSLTPGKVLYDALAGTKQVFLLGPMLIVTEIVNYVSKRSLLVVGLSGEGWDEYGASVVAHVERYAREQGCTEVECVGRNGWVDLLRKHGWERRAVIVGKEL